MSSGKVVTSVGYERRYNDAITIKDRERFTAYMEEDQPLKPSNILNIVATNQGRRELTGSIPKARPLALARTRELMAEGHAVIDNIVTFSVMASSLPLIAWIYSHWGFDGLFKVLALAAAGTFIAVIMLPRAVSERA